MTMSGCEAAASDAVDDPHPADDQPDTRLEVQVGISSTGDPIWKDEGPIKLLDGEATTPISSSGTNHNDDTKAATKITALPGCSQLPVSAKRWFGAKSKRERQDLYLYRHAPNGAPSTNLLIMLHGAGDSHRPFDKLGQRMQLPQTAVLSMSARKFVELPFQLGHSWFQEMDYRTGEVLPRESLVRQSSLAMAVDQLCDFIQLLTSETWIPERVFLFGYGAGATLAMAVCNSWWVKHLRPTLGGAICVGGGDVLVSGESEPTLGRRSDKATPTLLMVGSRDEMFSPQQALEIQSQYGRGGEVQVHVQPDKGRGMVSSEDDMWVVMKFLADKLVRISKMGQS